MNGLVSQIIMICVGLLLIYLAIKKEMEPTLLLPMGFGAILVNIPGSVMLQDNAILQWLYNVGIESAEAFPLLLFIGIGASPEMMARNDASFSSFRETRSRLPAASSRIV